MTALHIIITICLAQPSPSVKLLKGCVSYFEKCLKTPNFDLIRDDPVTMLRCIREMPE